MIVSETLYRVTSRWQQACVLLCAMVVAPCGMAYAQDYDAVGKRLREAVQAGELTGEQARAMLGALRKTAEHEGQRNAAVQDERVAKYRGIAARIKAAVEAGKMSEEDAEKKLIAIRMEMWPPKSDGDANGDGVEDRIRSIGDRLKRAVEAGKLSEEEAWAKWFHIKENEIAPRLKAAVKAGDMSEEEAWAIWRGIEKGEAAERLRAAVEKGELTEEEARAKWAEIDKEGDKDDEKILGMILVPTEGLNEDDAEMEIGETEPLALLFCSPSILPATDGGTLIDRNKLHSVTITDGDNHGSPRATSASSSDILPASTAALMRAAMPRYLATRSS